MKRLNITKDKFTESKYFTTKYGKLAYVSESGNLYKTTKGKVLKFVNESNNESYRIVTRLYVAGEEYDTQYKGDEPFLSGRECKHEFNNYVSDFIDSIMHGDSSYSKYIDKDNFTIKMEEGTSVYIESDGNSIMLAITTEDADGDSGI